VGPRIEVEGAPLGRETGRTTGGGESSSERMSPERMSMLVLPE
jgi:hypothetical protein